MNPNDHFLNYPEIAPESKVQIVRIISDISFLVLTLCLQGCSGCSRIVKLSKSEPEIDGLRMHIQRKVAPVICGRLEISSNGKPHAVIFV